MLQLSHINVTLILVARGPIYNKNLCQPINENCQAYSVATRELLANVSFFVPFYEQKAV